MNPQKNRGFTLIELMVSLTAGLVISAAAFVMARNATNFFQYESGITSAQYSVMVGLTRLQADFKNASYLGALNVREDDANGKFCGEFAELTPFAAGPHPGLSELAGVHLVENGSYNAADATIQAIWDLNTAAGMKPDAIDISGSINTTEEFVVASVSGAGPYTVVLNNVNDGASIRTRNSAARGGSSFFDIFRGAATDGAGAPRDRILGEGRILRVRDNEGNYSLGVISPTAADVTDNGTVVRITLMPLPVLGKREVMTAKAPPRNCGCEGFCVGAPVSVITRMHYDLRAVPLGAGYDNLFERADLAADGDAARVARYHRGSPLQPLRTELVRVEFAPDGKEIPGTLEVIAEHVVDLEFGASFETTAAPLAPNVPPVLDREPVGTVPALRYTIAGVPSAAGAQPDLIRSLQVRLSARAHRRDRDVGLPAMADTTVLRFNLGPTLLNPAQGFARMRTLVADITLPNQKARIAP